MTRCMRVCLQVWVRWPISPPLLQLDAFNGRCWWLRRPRGRGDVRKLRNIHSRWENAGLPKHYDNAERLMHTWDSGASLPPSLPPSISLSLCVWDVFDWRRAPVTPGSEPSIPLEAVFALLPTPLEVSCRWRAAERAADSRVPESGWACQLSWRNKKPELIPGWTSPSRSPSCECASAL